MKRVNPFKAGDKVKITRRGLTDKYFNIVEEMEEMIGDGLMYTISHASKHDGLKVESITFVGDSDYIWHYTSLTLYEEQDEDNKI